MLEQTEKYANTLIEPKKQLQTNKETLELKVQQGTDKLQLLNNEITETLNQVETMQDGHGVLFQIIIPVNLCEQGE
ncbi:MAG: hypothetical protein GY694_07180 [Gammaproteobacteria bacterium]|nr:hypothetical protein [Gammaproteobacteria bacterium]